MTNYITEIHLHNNGSQKARNGNGRSANYINSYNPVKIKGERIKQVKDRRGRPPSTYKYSIKIVHDPLSIGNFYPGKEFSLLDFEAMLQNCAFTEGTSIIVDNKLCFIHNNGNKKQVIKRMKIKTKKLGDK